MLQTTTLECLWGRSIITSRVSLLPAFRTSILCWISVVPKAADYFTSRPSPWATHPWKSLQISFSRGAHHHHPLRYLPHNIFDLFYTVSCVCTDSVARNQCSWRPPTPAKTTVSGNTGIVFKCSSSMHNVIASIIPNSGHCGVGD